MNNVYANLGASASQINLLAEWVKRTVSSQNENFDTIRFIEIELPKVFPGIYLHIESDELMGIRRAFVVDKPLGIVVSESTYEGAANGCLFSQEVLLHEIGHLFLHYRYAALGLNNAATSYRNRVTQTPLANSAEWQANSFALSFLYPFPKLKDVKSPDEIVSLYSVSYAHAQKIYKHLQKIRIRQDQSDHNRDKKWLTRIVRSLSAKKMKRVETKLQSQLLLFFANRRLAPADKTKNPPTAIVTNTLTVLNAA